MAVYLKVQEGEQIGCEARDMPCYFSRRTSDGFRCAALGKEKIECHVYRLATKKEIMQYRFKKAKAKR